MYLIYFTIKLQGLVAYSSQKYQSALDHFIKALQANPVTAGASVRLAIAVCCFKLEQFDRARVAVEKCIALDVSERRGLFMLIFKLYLLFLFTSMA